MHLFKSFPLLGLLQVQDKLLETSDISRNSLFVAVVSDFWKTLGRENNQVQSAADQFHGEPQLGCHPLGFEKCGRFEMRSDSPLNTLSLNM